MSDSNDEFERFLQEAEASLTLDPPKRKSKPGVAYPLSSAAAVTAAAEAVLVSSKLSQSHTNKSKRNSLPTRSTKKKSGKQSTKTQQLLDSDEQPPSYYDDNLYRRGGLEKLDADPYAFDLPSPAFPLTARNDQEFEDNDRAKTRNSKKIITTPTNRAGTKCAPISIDDRIAAILKRTGSTQFQADETSDANGSSDKESNDESAATFRKLEEMSSCVRQMRPKDDKNGNQGSGKDAIRSSILDSVGRISADLSTPLSSIIMREQPQNILSSLDNDRFAVNRDALHSDTATPSRYELQEMAYFKSDSVSTENEARELHLCLSKSDTSGYGNEAFEEECELSRQDEVSQQLESQIERTAQDDVQATQDNVQATQDDVEYSDDYHDDAYNSVQDDAHVARDVQYSDDYEDEADSSTQDDVQAIRNLSYSDDDQDDACEAKFEAGRQVLCTATLEPHQAVKKDIGTDALPVATNPNSKLDAYLANNGILNTHYDDKEVGATGPVHELKLETQDILLRKTSPAENVISVYATTTTAKESTSVVSSLCSSPPPPPPPDDNEENRQEMQHFSLEPPHVIDLKYLAQPPVQDPVTALEKYSQSLSATANVLHIENQVASLGVDSPDTPSLVAANSQSGRVHFVASKGVAGPRDVALVGLSPPVLEPMSLSFDTAIQDTQQEIDDFVRTSIIVGQDKQEAAKRGRTARENGLVLRLQQAQRQILQLKEYLQTIAASDVTFKLTTLNPVDAGAENGKLRSSSHPLQAALEKLQKEIQTQDTLIAAFQKENERLMQQLKQVRHDVQYDVHETNAELRRQVKALQEQLGDVAVRGEGSVLTTTAHYHVAVTARLEAEAYALALQEELGGLRSLHQQKLNELTFELDRVKKAKIELECRYENVDLTRMAQEAQHARELQQELDFVQKEHVHAMAAVQRKLDWYVENQRLLDGQDSELRQLRCQVAAQSVEPTASADAKARGPSPAGSHGRAPMDIRRIQELECRLAEVEGAMRRRHPDSLANLIVATRRADDDSKTRALAQEYQDKIAALSRELEQAHEMTETKVASFRQKQEKLRLQYTRKIKEQDKLLTQLRKAPVVHRLVSKDAAGALSSSEAEVAKLRRFYTDKMKDLERKWQAKSRALRKQQYSSLTSNQQVQGRVHVDSAVAIANLQRQIREQELIITQERAKVEQLEAASQLGHFPLCDSFALDDMDKLKDQLADSKAQLKDSENARARVAHTSNSVQTLGLVQTLHSEPSRPHTVPTSSDELEVAAFKTPEAELTQLRQELDTVRERLTSERAGATQNTEKQLAAYKEKTVALEAQLVGTQREAQRLQKLLVQGERDNQSQAQRMLQLEDEALALRSELKQPRTASMVEYQSLELKVTTLEQKYKLREAELKVVLDRALTSTHFERLSREQAHCAALAAKNAEIASFKRQLEEILDELAQLQAANVNTVA